MTETTPRLKLELPSDTTIQMARSFNAPKHLLFEAHSKPEHLRRWWGQHDAPLSVCDVDFRVGGKWRFVQRSMGSGEEFAFHGEFREIIPDERITWTFEFEGMPGHVSVERLSFIDHPEGTLLVSLATFDSKDDRDAMLESGMEAGAAESLDRLGELLGSLQA